MEPRIAARFVSWLASRFSSGGRRADSALSKEHEQDSYDGSKVSSNLALPKPMECSFEVVESYGGAPLSESYRDFACTHSDKERRSELCRVVSGIEKAVNTEGKTTILIGESHANFRGALGVLHLLEALDEGGWPEGLPRRLIVETDDLLQEEFDGLTALARETSSLAAFERIFRDTHRRRQGTYNDITRPKNEDVTREANLIWSLARRGFVIVCGDHYDPKDGMSRDQMMARHAEPGGVYYVGLLHAARGFRPYEHDAHENDLSTEHTLATLLGKAAYSVRLSRAVDRGRLPAKHFDDTYNHH